MKAGDVTVFAYAAQFAQSRGMTLVMTDDTGLGPGTMLVDPVKQMVMVHPDSHRITLEMNTRGGLLPGAYEPR